jgi:hypothetical protein
MEGRVTQIKYLLLKERQREIYFFGNSKITNTTGVGENKIMQQYIRSKTYHFRNSENFEKLIKKIRGEITARNKIKHNIIGK